MTNIKTKTEIISTLKDSHQRVLDWFTAIPTKDFFTRHGEEWSPSDNVDHLIRSHRPVTKALKLPLFTLKGMFGAPEQASRSYEAVCDVYREQLAKGGVASGRYLPEQGNPERPEDAKASLLNQFDKASSDLVTAAEKWGEEELDGYLLPHPLLGKLTIREMFYFTIYHNLRHATLEGD
jgi:hypothetical protein